MHSMKKIALAGLLGSVATLAQAELIYGITTTGVLNRFDSASAGTVTSIGAVSGVVAGQTLRGVDFRPSDGQLYAMSSSGAAAQLYTINLATGAATAIGAGLTLTGNTSTRISLDFNPVANALRVVTGGGQSYRVNANTGALILQDTSIATPAGVVPLISGVAYTNNVAGATSTTLYAYDFNLDNLGTIGGIGGVPSPNTGVFNIVGNSGVVSGNAGAGFDISGATGIAYLSFDDLLGSPDIQPEFYSMNLATGVVTQIGDFGTVDLLDFSVQPIAVRVPIAGTLSLAALGLLLVGGAGRRRKVAAAA